MIAVENEVAHYARAAHTNARIASALNRQDVIDALAKAPDATGMVAWYSHNEVTITANVWLDDGEDLSDIADSCNGSAYVVDVYQTILKRRGVEVRVNINGRQKLTDDERDLLRAIGKLQEQTHEVLVCGS